MDMTEEQKAQAESDVANAKAALDKGMDVLQTFMDAHQAVPAIKHIEEESLTSLMREHPYSMAKAQTMDPELSLTMSVAIMSAFLAGVEWGKSGRDFVSFYAHCDHPEHQARKN